MNTLPLEADTRLLIDTALTNLGWKLDGKDKNVFVEQPKTEAERKLLGVNEHFEGEHNFAIKVSTRACAMSNRSKVKLSLDRLTPKSPC